MSDKNELRPVFAVTFLVESLKMSFASLDEIVAVGKAIECARKKFTQFDFLIGKPKYEFFFAAQRDPSSRFEFFLVSPSNVSWEKPRWEKSLVIDASAFPRELGDLPKLREAGYASHQWCIRVHNVDRMESFAVKALWPKSEDCFADFVLQRL